MKNTPFNNLLFQLIPVVTNLQYFLKKEFVTENFYKHFFASMVILFLGIRIFDLRGLPLPFILFLGYLGGYIINFSREWYLAKFKGTPFSSTDIIFGGYGGLVGTLIYILLQ